MKKLANRLAMQHLVNAYAQETNKAFLLEMNQQNSTQIAFSQGLTLLIIPLECLQAQILFPLSYVSVVGRHRLAKLPKVSIKGGIQAFSSVAVATLMLEDLIQQDPNTNSQCLDSASLLERWIQSRDALEKFLILRAAGSAVDQNDRFNRLVDFEQNYIESEQALILGHSMHPAPKSRTGFVHEDCLKFSPEAEAKTQLNFWLIAPEYIVEDSSLESPISEALRKSIKWHLNECENNILNQYMHYKLLPLHPWQARYLQSKDWFKSLKQKNKLIELGEKAWQFSPTTSVRTLASFEAPWQLKPSLSVMVTNSIRVNLEKECHRGVMTHQLWHSQFGLNILAQCPTLKAVNDPAWIALKIDDQVVNETICIFREQPFDKEQQVTCIASLCQDHPAENLNRFNAIFENIQQNKSNHVHEKAERYELALAWFQQFLEISLKPLMYLYHQYGMAFEAHQQNVLVELEHGLPKTLWLRDNQGFYYIEELAKEVLSQFPALKNKAYAVGSQAFVDERFSYYFFGNTLFGIINAIGATGYITEQQLLEELKSSLEQLLKIYPNSSLIQGLLFNKTIPYKGNLLTRLHELDELTASVELQSVYVQLNNPLWIKHEEVAYA
ncbi:MAG: siderophore biosynthesis protein [Candidatus Acinetobacter avistercoris]|uniref:IucA/IucC family protein n=1 Tax=Acinetobacter sp. KS-LM10 TaxID=3120518 RepID=UPI001F9CA8F6|nr:siderophore biosynthesis protein [Candidatus Acinetobacter avistercoris]